MVVVHEWQLASVHGDSAIHNFFGLKARYELFEDWNGQVIATEETYVFQGPQGRCLAASSKARDNDNSHGTRSAASLNFSARRS